MDFKYFLPVMAKKFGLRSFLAKKGLARRVNLPLSPRPASNSKSPLVLQVVPHGATCSLEGNPA
jgi:hypothetical protein